LQSEAQHHLQAPGCVMVLFCVEHATCVWVDSDEAMAEAAAVMRKASVIAVDVEGKNLGHKGRVATIQLATNEKCFVIDLAALGMPISLRKLLQDSSPVKICHGFSGDQINLIEQFQLDFSDSALFDTQEAVDLMANYTGSKGVVDILTAFTGASSRVIAEMQAMKKKLQWVDFFKRPLPDNVLRYACLDVIFLWSAYEGMVKQLGPQASAQAMESSRYVGPYASGKCFQPPTGIQIKRQKQKGKTWDAAKKDWVKSGEGHELANALSSGKKRKLQL